MSQQAKALWRNIRILIRQFRTSLLLFALILCMGTLCLRFFYHPHPNQHLTWVEALYATFTLVFFQPEIVDFSQAPPGIKILFFVIPIIGLAVVTDGIIRLGATLFNLRERKEAWLVAMASTYQNHIVICGLGRVGYRVAKELLHMGEEDIIGIDIDKESSLLEEIRNMNVPVLIGDVRKQEILEKANIEDASAIVLCTQNDLTNLDAALEARTLNPNIKVVMRMFDTQLATRVRQGFAIHTAFSTSALAAPVFAAAATRAQIDYSFYVNDVLLNVARTTVQSGSQIEQKTIGDVEAMFDISIVLHNRGGEIDLHPTPDVDLQAGDCLVIFGSRESLAQVRKTSGPGTHRQNQNTKPRSGLKRLFTPKKKSM